LSGRLVDYIVVCRTCYSSVKRARSGRDRTGPGKEAGCGRGSELHGGREWGMSEGGDLRMEPGWLWRPAAGIHSHLGESNWRKTELDHHLDEMPDVKMMVMGFG
jgi:hypothetical protein